MKILVYDIAAKNGGGLQILQSFLDEVTDSCDNTIQWYFVVSQSLHSDSDNIHILTYPDTEKSWLHRLLFEHTTLLKILREINPDCVLSLQNTTVPKCQKPQAVYYHQPLPFCSKRFSFFKAGEFSLAFRQRVICKIFKHGLKHSDLIFVQTEWMKSSVKKWLDNTDKPIKIVPVTYRDFMTEKIEKRHINRVRFFYPASPYIYKNHSIIADACKILKETGVTDFDVTFTISKNDNQYSRYLAEKSLDLPIFFTNSMTHADVMNKYKNSVLVFPSYLESCGLPLIEARLCSAYILAVDLPYAHEMLDGYDNCEFFKYDNPNELADKMENLIHNGYDIAPDNSSNTDNRDSLLQRVVDFAISHT